MPEGPEVRVIGEGMAGLIKSRPLLDLGWNQGSRYAKKGLPGLSLIQPGVIVRRVLVRGKKILTELIPPSNDSPPVYLLTFLGMSGRWSVYPDAHSNLWLKFGPRVDLPSIQDSLSQWEVLVTPFTSPESFTLYFSDLRHFGRVELLPDPWPIISALGPDLLNETVSFELYKQAASRGLKLDLPGFLLKQEICSGVGNYLKSEILYRARLAPFRYLGELTEEELYRLWETSIRTIREAYQSRGLTITDYLDLFGQRGVFKKLIYREDFDPQGWPVLRDTFGDGRTTFWVPQVQNPEWLDQPTIQARLAWMREKAQKKKSH